MRIQEQLEQGFVVRCRLDVMRLCLCYEIHVGCVVPLLLGFLVFAVFGGRDFLIANLAESQTLNSNDLLRLSIHFLQCLPTTLMV